MSLNIRPFSVEDLDSVNEIENASFRKPWPTSFLTYMHVKAPNLFLVAVLENRVAGYVIGELREIMFSGIPHRYKIGHILNIAVDVDSRQLGVGTSLLKEVERRFMKMGATKVTLEVRESNSVALSFYLIRGYEEIGRVRAYYPDEDAIIMSKTLKD